MAVFLVGGKNAHQQVHISVIAKQLLGKHAAGPNAVAAMVKQLVKANPVLQRAGVRTYLAGHYLNLPAGVHPLNSGQQNAFDLLSQTLNSWGLSTLLPDLKKLILGGDTNSDTLALALSQTAAYKKRFAANADRVKAGLAELTPAEYLATEEQYRQVLASYGLPKGFYDNQAALDKYISGDVSPSELDARAKVAHDTYLNAPSSMKALWGRYGFSQGDAIAGILDPKVATSLIQDRGLQVQIGGAAAAHGLNIDQSRAQQFEQAGVTQASADKAYAAISGALPIDQQIADRFGTTFDQTQEENDALLGQADATAKRQSLYDAEQGLFKAHGGADTNSLAVNQSNY